MAWFSLLRRNSPEEFINERKKFSNKEFETLKEELRKVKELELEINDLSGIITRGIVFSRDKTRGVEEAISSLRRINRRIKGLKSAQQLSSKRMAARLRAISKQNRAELTLLLQDKKLQERINKGTISIHKLLVHAIAGIRKLKETENMSPKEYENRLNLLFALVREMKAEAEKERKWIEEAINLANKRIKEAKR